MIYDAAVWYPRILSPPPALLEFSRVTDGIVRPRIEEKMKDTTCPLRVFDSSLKMDTIYNIKCLQTKNIIEGVIVACNIRNRMILSTLGILKLPRWQCKAISLGKCRGNLSDVTYSSPIRDAIRFPFRDYPQMLK